MTVTDLFDGDYLYIGGDDAGWLYADWKGYQTVTTVKEGCEHILRLMVERGARGVLNDNTRVMGIWSGASEWVAVDWFPRMHAAGLKCFAWVYSPSRFSQISTDETLARMDADAAGVRVFSDAADARRWLRGCLDRGASAA